MLARACLLLLLSLCPVCCRSVKESPSSQAKGAEAAVPSERTRTEPVNLEPSGPPSTGGLGLDAERLTLPPPAEPREPRRDSTPSADSEPHGAKKVYRVAALGDSITDERVGGGGYLKFLRAACPESRFEDFGKGGDMTNQMRTRLLRDLLPAHQKRQFDTLLVYGGVNDLYSDLTAGRTNERIEAELSRVYAEAHQQGLRVVAVTVSPWGGFHRYFNQRRGNNTRLLNAWILERESKREVDVVVDSYPLLSCGDPQKLCPEFEKPHPDGLHLGKAGHARLGQALLDQAFSDCR